MNSTVRLVSRRAGVVASIVLVGAAVRDFSGVVCLREKAVTATPNEGALGYATCPVALSSQPLRVGVTMRLVGVVVLLESTPITAALHIWGAVGSREVVVLYAIADALVLGRAILLVPTLKHRQWRTVQLPLA
eukprot:1179973-Prorocentrum_minimum.AAC.2